MSRVGVVGLGTMGSGIAQCFAAAGFEVTAWDVSDRAVADGIASIEVFTADGVRRSKLREAERTALLARITSSTDLSTLAGCDLVVEAIIEDPEVKKAKLREVSNVVAEHAIIATNTSALSVTDLATAVASPERFVGMHFLNPPPLMPLVEVVPALQTSQDVVDRVVETTAALGKESMVVADRPGFLLNSLLLPYLNQAVHELDQALGEAEDIDTAVRLGLGYPMGPYEMLDLIGLDAHHRATKAVYQQTGDPRLAPPPLLSRMVSAGRLGNKSGRGFREGNNHG